MDGKSIEGKYDILLIFYICDKNARVNKLEEKTIFFSFYFYRF